MFKTRQRTYLIAVAALLLAFAGCKGESPTSPTPTPPGGGVTPPSGAAVALTVSNATPLVDSTVTITATVTVGGTPAPNGTAIQFQTNLGTFTEANASSVIRTTTGGVATVTLTASAAGVATITATVNNVSNTAKVTFSLKPVTPPPPDLTPSITSISPSVGRPQGGELLTITGKNFASPKVIFDFGGGKTAEAFLVSATSTQIQVLTPAVDLGTGQQKTATIVVINNVGTPNEVRVTAGTTFTFQSEVLTPSIISISPTSGPIDGGTKVVIFGEGFQAPLQVFFGSADASIVGPITFNQITVIAPTARDTSPNGSETVTGPVDIKIINLASNKTVTATSIFRYVQKMNITAVSPTSGSAFGGTDISIDGIGFNDPVTVDIGLGAVSVRASVLFVSSTHILARTGRLASPCSGLTGPVTVTNVDNGDVASSIGTQGFTYFPVNPFVNSVTSGASPITTGSPINITVTNPGVGPLGDAAIGMTLGGIAIPVTPNPIQTAQGTVVFSSTVPTTGLTFPTVSCVSGGLPGTQSGPLIANLIFTNLTTTCTATLLNALTIQPPAPNPCVVQPTATASAPPACFPATTATTTSGTTRTITISNTSPAGAQSLNITSVTPGGTNGTDFSVVPTSASNIAPGSSQVFTVSFTPGAAGARSGTITFATNDPAHSTIVVPVCGTGL
jgi:IPT/TIG domain-containing protein/ASPM-SPD-2-Hydin domain-containing protein